LEELCRRYWLPVYVTIRSSDYGFEDAEDLTQDFFASLISRSDLEKTAPEKGRFRSFVLKSLKHFLITDWRHRNRKKRGGEVVLVSIDRDLGEERFEIASGRNEDPERVFERQWARELLERTMKQLADACGQEGKARQFAILRPYLAGADETHTYATIADDIGISESGARMAMFRLRGRFRRMLWEEIAETVTNEETVDEEIQHFFEIFAR